MATDVVPEDPGPEEATPPSRPLFYAVGIPKLAVMYPATFGLYGLHWMYENWWNIKERRGSKLQPLWRALLAPIFIYPLFREIRRAADEHKVSTAFPALGAGLLYVVGYLIHFVLVDDFWPVAMACMFVPLHAAQRVANAIHTVQAPTTDRNERFSIRNAIAVAIGGTLFLLALWDTYESLRERLLTTFGTQVP